MAKHRAHDGICAAGVATSDHLGNPHAISVPVPTATFVHEEASVTKHLLKAKATLCKLVEYGFSEKIMLKEVRS